MTPALKWSPYERQARKAFDEFMKTLKIGDIITTYDGEKISLDRCKVLGITRKEGPGLDAPFEERGGIWLILRHPYDDSYEQQIFTAGMKTPWFDKFVIHRELVF